MVHDFKRFPELTNSQMAVYYFESPHKQIFEGFHARVVKVTDGDTVMVRWSQRNFDFPVRFADTNAPEMKDEGGKESKSWLEQRIMNAEVDILVDPRKRVGKFGRLIGTIVSDGANINQESIMAGHAMPFNTREEGQIPDINKMMNAGKIE